MKVLLIGLGSAGRRHQKLLREITPVQILAFRSGNGESLPSEITAGVQTCHELSAAIRQKPDFAVISNPTVLHVETALKLAKAGIPFLIEKPVSDSLENLDLLETTVREKNLPVMVGFQLRFHPGYKKMAEIVGSGAVGKPLHLSGYIGQYLPDWRPHSNQYQECYSAIKELGGGVILDLTHGIDLALSLMGPAACVACMADHCSTLKIDTEDMANILIRHQEKRYSSIHLNYFERRYTWWTRVTGDKGSVLWDYAGGFVRLERPDRAGEEWKVPDEKGRDSLFADQLKHWLKVLRGEAKPAVSLREGIAVTEVAVACKRAIKEQKFAALNHA